MSCSLLVCLAMYSGCWRVAAAGTVQVGAAISLVAGHRRGLRRGSVSCWGSRCAWRDTVDISNRSRWFVSVTGPPFCSLRSIVPDLLPVWVLGALVPVAFAETYIRWQRGLAFTVITAGCVLAHGCASTVSEYFTPGRAYAPRYPERDLHPSTGGPCPSPPGDRVEQRRGAENVGEHCSPSAPPNSRRHVPG